MAEAQQSDLNVAIRKPFAFTKVGSIVASFDFYLGVPVGMLAGLALILSEDGRESSQSAMFMVVASGVTLVALILTAMAVLIATISPEYSKLLSKVPGGVAGTAAPFLFVAKTSALAAIAGLLASGILPAIEVNLLLSYFIASAPFALLAWSILGCVQLAGQLVYHWDRNLEAVKLVQALEKQQKI